MTRRVVITGLGAVSGFGIGAEPLWEAALAGRSAEREVELEDGSSLIASVVPDFDPDGMFGRRAARRMDRCGQLAAAAAGLALADAGDLGASPDHVGAAIGTAHGGTATLDAAYSAHLTRGADRVSPLAVPLSLPNTAVTAAARTHQLRGPTLAPASACAAGADAIGLAAMHIRAGSADVMVAGGADAPLSPVIVAGYRQSGALTRGTHGAGRCSRPFDAERDGFVIGEGAAALVLEEREHAIARDARIYCELAGYGASCDASHLTDPEPSGAGPGRAIAAALASAGSRPQDVGYVNAHATSTPAGDAAEATALSRAGLARAATSSTKGATGHALGAAGGLEAVVTTRAIAEGTIPPTANLGAPDTPHTLRHVLRATPAADLRLALSSSFGFGGQNACLVLARAEA